MCKGQLDSGTSMYMQCTTFGDMDNSPTSLYYILLLRSQPSASQLGFPRFCMEKMTILLSSAKERRYFQTYVYLGRNDPNAH